MRPRREDEPYVAYKLARLGDYIKTQLALKGWLFHDSGFGMRNQRRLQVVGKLKDADGKLIKEPIPKGKTYNIGRNKAKRQLRMLEKGSSK